MTIARVQALAVRYGRLALGELWALVPAVLAAVCLLCGIGLAVVGVDMLFGRGWSLIAGAVPCLAVGFVLLRGLTNG